MNPAPFTLEMIAVFLITLYLLHQYGSWRKQHWLVSVAVFVAWYFSFLIVFILPLDVSDTFYRKCLAPANKDGKDTGDLPNYGYSKFMATNSSNMSTPSPNVSRTTTVKLPSTCQEPWSYLNANVLPDLWRVVYWSSQILSWIVLPLMQSYSYAGEFTIRGKIKTALYENALWYGSYLIIFGVLLIYVIVKPNLSVDSTQLKIIGITASNTWGLLLLVLLMGYGLVEIPRTMWYSARLEYKMAHAYFKVSKLSVEREESEEQLADVLEDVRKASENIRYTHSLREHLEVILKKCPESSQSTFSKGTDDFVDYDDYLKEQGGKGSQTYTEKALVKLHRRVIVVTQSFRRTHCQYNLELENIFSLEDISRNRTSHDRHFKSTFHPSTEVKWWKSAKTSFEWYWKVWMRPWVFRIAAVLFLLLSLAVIWSEVTFFTGTPVLSIFALLIRSASEGYFYFYVELISCLTISYMCACVYYTVFKMRFFNYYYFAPNHQTDPNSLLFSGLLLCRLTYALCLNFLALIHLDGHVTEAADSVETSFTAFMGHMDVLSFISKGVNVYYPMCVLLVCLATYFSLGTRCLNCLGFQTFIIEDDLSAEYMNEGKDIVKRERRKREMLTGEGRKETWTERAETAKRKFTERSRQLDEQGRGGLSKDQATSSTNLTNSDVKYTKYSRLDPDNDRVELLSATDYDPDFLSDRALGRSRAAGRPPKNIFDDV